MRDRSDRTGARRRTSIVLSAFRGRLLAELIRSRGDEILTLAPTSTRFASAAGWRRQATQHGVDVLVAGLEGERLEQDEYGRPRLVREAAA